MRKILTLIFLIFTSLLYSQIYNPVSWSFSQNKISKTEVELKFKANIEENWHLYSQDIEESPPATSFTFIIDGDTSIKLLKEPESIEEYDSNFAMKLKNFVDEAIFTYNINFKEGETLKIDGYVNFMVCLFFKCGLFYFY